MKLTSVVISHNVAAYLPDCLGSLRRNTAPDIEYVFVDDRSTDGSRALLEQAVARLPNSRLIVHPENRGASAARNTGIDMARGEYVTFLDGDDWLAPGYYPRLADACTRLGVDFVRVDHLRAQGRKRTLQRAPESRRGVPIPSVEGIGEENRETMADYVNAWSGGFRSGLRDNGLLYFDTSLRTCEDRLWNWRLHLHTRSFAVVGLAGLFYRRDVGGSLTSVGDDRQLDFLPASQRIIEEAVAHCTVRSVHRKAVRTLLGLTHFHLKRTDRLDKRVARQFPGRYRALAASLPQDLLGEVLDAMDAPRRSDLTALYRPRKTACPR
ncbi:glycosyltransferase family 2 protein [Streptomyces sp. NPDC051954]|uniref:glycosyltransferase family 2 protein n=1 Tax=unclassified Streptomyces TaxID=2593676 RepID=UPI00341BC2C8